MNTWTIIQILWRHWRTPTHPVYRVDAARSALPPNIRQVGTRIVARTWRPIGLAGLAVIALLVGDFLCRAGRRGNSISSAIFSIITVGIGGGIFVGLLLLTYLWPLAVAVFASNTIAEERERQTWDVLLTTPFEWSDLLMAKL